MVETGAGRAGRCRTSADDVGRQEKSATASPQGTSEEARHRRRKKTLEEIDFGSFFQDYLDPGYRSSGEMEEIEKPSFENFLSSRGI